MTRYEICIGNGQCIFLLLKECKAGTFEFPLPVSFMSGDGYLKLQL